MPKKADPYKGLPNKELLKQFPFPITQDNIKNWLLNGGLIVTVDNQNKETKFYMSRNESQIQGWIYTWFILNNAGTLNIRMAEVITGE